jgi:hypothetical protein
MFLPIKTVSERGWTSWRAWQIVPSTLTVVAGPFIAILYYLTRLEYAKDGSFSLAQALRGILCLMMFLSLFLSRDLRLLEHPIIRPLIFLAIYAVMTCMFGPYPYENIAFAVKLTFTAFVFASAFHLAQSKLCSERWLIGSAWVVLIFMAISQVIGLVTGNTVASYESDFATAGVIDATSVTAILIVSTLPVFLRFFPYCRWSLAGILIALVSLFFTMQRTSLIAAAIAIMIVLIRYLDPFRRGIPWIKVLLSVSVLSILVVIVLQSQAGHDLLSRMDDLVPPKGSGSGRYIFWFISLNHILNRDISAQILGEGMGSIRDVMDRHYGVAIGSHNALLDLTHAFGVFGLMAIVWSYLELIRFAICLRTVKDLTLQGVFSAIVILFLISLGTGVFYDPGFALIYIALGFWAGRVSYYRRQTPYARCASNRTV